MDLFYKQKSAFYRAILLFAVLFSGLSAVQAQYCIPTFSSGCGLGDDIDDFDMPTAGISHFGTGCSQNAYDDFTSDSSLIGTLEAGMTYSFTSTHNNSSMYISIWVDLNNDSIFDSNELLFTSSGGSGTHTGTISIPPSISSATTSMRVMANWNSAPNGPCDGGSSWGETHDYTVNLTVPSCPAPSSLSSISADTSSIEFDWIENGTATQWEIEYGTAGYTQGTGTSFLTNSNPDTVTGLSPGTVYDFYVRSICAPGDTSSWSQKLTDTTSCVTQLAGTYTIDASQPASATNYISFEDAVAEMMLCGISGPVLFDVEPGVYNEQIVIGQVPGISSSDTVVFRGQDPATTEISFEQNISSEAYTVRFEDASYITFDSITIRAEDAGSEGWAVHVFDDANNLNFNNVNFITEITSSTSNLGMVVSGSETGYTTAVSGTVSDIKIHDSYFEGGWAGARMNGSTSQDITGVEVVNCEFNEVDRNGLYYSRVSDFTVHNNLINISPNGSTLGAGVWLTNCGDFEITSNEVHEAGRYGFYNTNSGGSAGNRSLYANNVVTPIRNTGNFTGGFRILNGSSEYIDVIHNSIHFDDDARVFNISNSSPSNIRIWNNNFVNTSTGSGEAMYVSDESSVEAIDYNNYYTAGSDFVYYGSSRANLADLQSVGTPANNDQNSVSGDPLFVSPNNLMPLDSLLNESGTYIQGIDTDIDGNPRDTANPDIGAYEFTPASCFPVSSMIADNLGQNSAELAWTDNSGASHWQIEWDTAGFSQGSGDTVTTGSNPYNLSGLTSETTYEFYVRTICSSGDTSMWTGPIEFTTLCPPFSAPYTENFDGPTWISGSGGSNDNDQIDHCWSRDPETSNDFFWGTRSGSTTSGNTGPDTAFTADTGNYVFTEATNGSTGDPAWIASPLIDLSTINNPFLEFAYHMYGSDIESLVVQVNDGSGWTPVDSIVGEQQSDNDDPWETKFVNLAQFNSDTISIRWYVERGSSFNGDIAIDAVSIFEQDSLDAGVIAFVEPESFCGDSLTPLAVVIENFGQDTISGFDVTIDWTGAASGSATTTYTGSLGFGETDTIVVDTVSTFPGGVFNLTAYTQLTGDQSPSNDTLVIDSVEFEPGLVTPTITSDTNLTICEGEDALFTATAPIEDLVWKDNSGNELAVGDSLLIPGVTGNDTFWASQGSVVNETVGLPTLQSSGTFISQSTGWGLGFTVYNNDIVIDEVTVFPEGSGTIEILILDQNTNNVIYTGPATSVSGPSNITTSNAIPNIVPVNVTLPPGDYKMGMSSTGISSLVRESGIGGYPYVAPSGNIEITGGSTGTGSPTSSSYYWFYDWQISTPGCESDPVMVTVSTDTVPDVDLGADTAYCEGDTPSFTFDAGAGASYLWSDSTTGQNLTADTAGVYWVEVTNANGCVGSDTVVVNEEATPQPDLGGNIGYCADDTAFSEILITGVAADSYLWSDGSGGTTFEVDTAGTYWVEVTTAIGCVGSDTITVTENQLPVVDLGSDLEFCSNETFTANLDAGGHTDVTYMWSDGSTDETLMITTADTYWVEATDTLTMCSYTDTVVVTEVPAPSVTVENDTVCDGEEATLEAGTGFDSYNWSTGESTSSINVTSQGEYFVTVTNMDGCEDSTSAMVEVLSLPVVDLGQDTALNEDEVAVLDAPGGMRTYNWNTGDTTESLEVQYGDVPNTFWVEVMNNDGCFGSDTIFIDQNVSAGAENLFNGDIKVYPNPVRNDANLEINLTKNGTLEIDVFSMSGQILKTKRVGGNAGDNFVPVEMNNLSKGMYMIRVRLDGERLGVFNISKM